MPTRCRLRFMLLQHLYSNSIGTNARDKCLNQHKLLISAIRSHLRLFPPASLETHHHIVTMAAAPSSSASKPPTAFPADGFPELYPLADHRYPPGAETTLRGSGRYQTRKNLFFLPKEPHKLKGPTVENTIDQRPAGVTTQQFSDTNMANLVGYKDQYWKLEVAENPERVKRHDIVTNKMYPPEPFRPAREVPIVPIPKMDQKGRVLNFNASEYREGY
ncbi:unnamed protein product [Amoebophrya sp. A120]|nr:unnamed protein product [Amoebophrya sp. A120]|eukprot:GSA120T00019241001.1